MINRKSEKAILTMVYPKVEAALKTHLSKYKKCVADFMTDRSKSMFQTMPLDRIFYGADDITKMFDSLGLEKTMVKNGIINTYYGNKANFNPRAAKDELTVLMMCVIRYFYIHNDTKNTEISSVYLAFSGKFYPSIHYMSFPKALPQDYIMQYVINNMLNEKFLLKSQGNLFSAILYICRTWIDSYKTRLNKFDDEDVVYMISQLHSRIRSFMINIAKMYYKAYQNKDYMTFDSDNENTDNASEYHIAESDSFKAERVIQKTMTYISSTGADYRLCKLASNKTVKTEELKTIIESILNDKYNLPTVKEVISILVYTYFVQSKEKNVLTMSFVSYSITPKPNTKDPHILKLKDIIEEWLNSGSVLYRKRKHRVATRNDYNKALLMYFALAVYQANK